MNSDSCSGRFIRVGLKYADRGTIRLPTVGYFCKSKRTKCTICTLSVALVRMSLHSFHNDVASAMLLSAYSRATQIILQILRHGKQQKHSENKKKTINYYGTETDKHK